MTVHDLFMRMSKEFPEESICITAEYWYHGLHGNNFDADLTIHCAKTREHDSVNIVARDLDDAFRRMRDFLDGGIAPDFGADALVPMNATIAEPPLVKVGQGTSETTIEPGDVLGRGGAR